MYSPRMLHNVGQKQKDGFGGNCWPRRVGYFAIGVLIVYYLLLTFANVQHCAFVHKSLNHLCVRHVPTFQRHYYITESKLEKNVENNLIK